jgi:tungstate transport system ATP-binding protein
MYLHQQPYMFDASVRKNLAYALPSGLSNAECSKRIDEALEWADLSSLATAPATNLSGGEAQRVALARAWLRIPLVLLLDEPMANMDQESRLRTHSLLHQLKNQGMAIIITSHDTMQFQSLTDRQLILQHGKISTQSQNNQAENVSAFPIAPTSLHHTA